MKVTKTFSIDLELVELINREKNGSLIINGILRDYFKDRLNSNVNIAEQELNDAIN